MEREKLIRDLRRYARKRKLDFNLRTDRGKGAHYRLRLGDKITTIQSGDLSPLHVKRICEQLGIDPADL